MNDICMFNTFKDLYCLQEIKRFRVDQTKAFTTKYTVCLSTLRYKAFQSFLRAKFKNDFILLFHFKH